MFKRVVGLPIQWVMAFAVLGYLALHSSVSAQSAASPPCVLPVHSERPWEYTSQVLDSFPPDVPPPTFVGRFNDPNHELHLWRDANGIFGEWLSPLLDADSPTSRLYDAEFDLTTRALTFATRVPGLSETFHGTLLEDGVRGRLIGIGENVDIVLMKQSGDHISDALRKLVVSRAQFNCEMTLYHRY